MMSRVRSLLTRAVVHPAVLLALLALLLMC